MENAIRSIVSTQRKTLIDIDDFSLSLEAPSGINAAKNSELWELPLKEARKLAVDEFEINYIRAVLDQSEGKVSLAARKAGVNRQNFYKLMRKHDIKKND